MKEQDRKEIRAMVNSIFDRHTQYGYHLIEAKNCPSCGHMTPFLKDMQKYFDTLPPSTQGCADNCNIFTCLNCGKSFRQAIRHVSEFTELPAAPQQ